MILWVSSTSVFMRGGTDPLLLPGAVKCSSDFNWPAGLKCDIYSVKSKGELSHSLAAFWAFRDYPTQVLFLNGSELVLSLFHIIDLTYAVHQLRFSQRCLDKPIMKRSDVGVL